MPTEPVMRKDARRNRDAIVQAAREAFAEDGTEVPIDVIAKRAGVGNATLYRRFPTREDLLTAVFLGPMEEQATAVEQAIEHPDPWTGFATYILETCRRQTTNRGLANVLSSEPASPELAALGQRSHAGTQDLLDRVQAAGAVRSDLLMEDIATLMMANAGIVDRAGPAAPAASERFVALTLDGWRADAATSTAPPAPDRQAMQHAIRTTPI